jgi:gamma-glutamyltranspeptidase/glutathione hydrolase
VDAGRIHHSWFPDEVYYERFGFGADTLERLEGMGYRMVEQRQQGAAQVIVARDGVLEAGVDRRDGDSGAAGW